jgi:hypothetical protein
MRLEINSGGLDSFFNQVGSFIHSKANDFNADVLIGSFQNVINKTNNLNGGVKSLDDALGFLQARKEIEENRKSAIQTVKSKADSFIQIAEAVDKAVAADVSASQEQFYKTNPWARPKEESLVEKLAGFFKGVGDSVSGFCGFVAGAAQDFGNWVGDKLSKIWDGVTTVFQKCWDGIKGFVKEHWKEILVGVAVIAAGALVTTLTGGAGLAGFVPALLHGLGNAALLGIKKGAVSAGLSFVGSVIKGDDLGTSVNNAADAFGDGLAGGFTSKGVTGVVSKISGISSSVTKAVGPVIGKWINSKLSSEEDGSIALTKPVPKIDFNMITLAHNIFIPTYIACPPKTFTVPFDMISLTQ